MNLMASPAEETLIMGRMGPKISSCITGSEGSTSLMIVGSMYRLDLSCFPPSSAIFRKILNVNCFFFPLFLYIKKEPMAMFSLEDSSSLTSLSKCLSETILHMSAEACTFSPYHSFSSLPIFSASLPCMVGEQRT